MEGIAFCGLDCRGCPAFIAHMTNDQALREKTSLEWSRMYESDIPANEVNCTGCSGDGIQFQWCRSGCPIRVCAIERRVSSCGTCSDYPCERLDFIIGHCPDAKDRLDAVKVSVKGAERQG